MEVKFSEQQKNMFKELGINLVYIFGSQIDGTQNKLSDIDVGVVFGNKERSVKDRNDTYTKLYSLFVNIFAEYRKVDLIFLQDTTLTLQLRAVLDGVIIYKNNEESEFNYKEQVMKYHADTQYFRNRRQQEILMRI